MIITTIGASSPNMDKYLEAYNLGKKIGLGKHTLKNGATGGIMEASAKGCSEAGGQVIGVGVVGHKKPNDYNTKVITKESVKDRIDELLNTDILMVLGGRLGTLEELFVAWMRNIGGRQLPIIIIGENFKKLIEYLVINDFVKLDCLQYLTFVDSIDDIDFQEDKKIVFKKVYLMKDKGRTEVYKDKVYNCSNNKMLA